MPDRSGAPPAGPVLILAPAGEDAATARRFLAEARIPADICATLDALCAAIDQGTGAVIVADEALADNDLSALTALIDAQPVWSDLPFIVLIQQDPAARRSVAQLHLPEALGNVMFLDRPLHALTLVSAVRTALRARRRQRQVRDRFAEAAAASNALQASEGRERLAMEAADLGAWHWDLRTGALLWSDRCKVLFGLPPEAAMSYERFLRCLHPGDWDRVNTAVQRSLALGTDYDVEMRAVLPGGSVRWIRAKGRAQRDAQGELESMQGVALDIHDKRNAEEALRDSRERLDTIISQASVGIAQTDATGRLTLANERYCQILGRSLPDVLGRFMQEQLHPDDVSETMLRFSRLLQTGEPFAVETRVLRPDGATVWVNIHVSVTHDRHGRPQHALAIVQDITARRSAEEALRQFNETLEARVAERTEALRASEAALAQSQKMEAVGRLTGGIAHDFNNQLTAVAGNLELLQRRIQQDEHAVRLAGAAFQATLRGAKLTAQLLAFSRTQQLDLKVVDVNAALQGAVELLATTLGPMVQLRLLPDPTIPPAIADLNQLELAILNLAINARDAMPDGGRLTIETGWEVVDEARRSQCDGALAPGRYVVVSVADTGSGMPPDVLARAMEPFFTTKAVGKGTGLGLAQVYGIARQSGGDVRISSAAGQGTTVCILLPEAPGGKRPGDSAQSGFARMGTAHGAPGTVLVVDDDDDVRRMFVAGLQAQGFQVQEAANGPAALQILDNGTAIDVAVLDFAMPIMSGATLAEAARRLRPDLPIVFASGYADTAALHAIPGTTILRKPIQMAELAHAVRRAVGPLPV